MKSSRYITVARLFVVLFYMTAVIGCRKSNTTGTSLALGVSHNGVLAIPNREVAELDADDIVDLMQAAGIQNKDIVALGPDLRDALSTTGGATIRVDGKVEAICMAESTRIIVTSRLRGAFIYHFQPPTPPTKGDLFLPPR